MAVPARASAAIWRIAAEDQPAGEGEHLATAPLPLRRGSGPVGRRRVGVDFGGDAGPRVHKDALVDLGGGGVGAPKQVVEVGHGEDSLPS
ncbi:MAG: hypothetical protein V9G19_05035 [Tetrasphaera sp.]